MLAILELILNIFTFLYSMLCVFVFFGLLRVGAPGAAAEFQCTLNSDKKHK